jgi:tetratricopeptide (TPR) repeat protein
LLGAAIVAVPGNEVLAHAAEKTPNRQLIDRLIASRRSVLTLISSSRDESDLAFALLLRAQQQPSKADVHEAAELLRHSLSLAPARPYAWTRLAIALAALDGPSPDMAVALLMAIKTAPDDGPPFDGLIVARIGLCLVALPYFPTDQLTLIHDQLRLAWWKRRDDTIGVVLATHSMNELVEALHDYPHEMSELKRLNLL